MTSPRSAGDPREILPLFEIVHTARLADRAFADAFSNHGLAGGEFGVLAGVNDNPGITQAHLARHLHVRPQTIARPVDRLIRRQLITPGTPTGRGGATSLFITDLGKARLDATWPAVVDLNTPHALGLTANEAACLARLLATVRAHITRTEPDS